MSAFVLISAESRVLWKRQKFILDVTNNNAFERLNKIAEIVAGESDGFLLFVKLQRLSNEIAGMPCQPIRLRSIVYEIMLIIT